jgi:hypothetical protein
LYYKKDSSGKVAQLIIKFKPTTASIKSNYAFFEGEHEVISTDPINQGLIRSNNTRSNDKKNHAELQCVEVAFDIPCSKGNVHPWDGPGWWCTVNGSYRISLKDCWTVGSSSSMASFTSTSNTSSTNSTGTVVVASSALSNIVLCEDSDPDNFILSLYYSYESWINSSTVNQNKFDQIVGSICGNSSDQNKEYIIKKLHIVKEANISLDEYNNWFEGMPGGNDGEDFDPSLIEYDVPLQNEPLPSLNNWINSFPKISNTQEMSAPGVYQLVGGSLYASHLNDTQGNYQNACAIRGSRALLYSGIIIPVLRYGNPPKQATQKGADNNNYILTAKSFNKFMNDKFGNATHRLTGADANDPIKVAIFLKGKNGIYVIINNDGTSTTGAGYSGHVDAIINGRCVGKAYTTPRGGVSSISVWELN